MGAADAVPGVSGGTIAFISGIYEELILTIKQFGPSAFGAWRQDGQKMPVKIEVGEKIADRPWQVVGSRSHNTPAVDAFVERLGDAELVAMGSSLKLCLVADGSADLYPRLGPTSEWDTCAAQAVVEEAGGQVLNAETGEPLTYNARESVLNPHFIVCSRPDPTWFSNHKVPKN